MPFTNPGFPGQIFDTVNEFEEARRKREEVENSIAYREEITRVTATIIPAPNNLLEKKVSSLEQRLHNLEAKASPEITHNKEGLEVSTTLRSESLGREYTLDILEEGYLCSDGNIYDSLSGAAFGVSGNRRSGWKFWKDVAGTPIGEVTGRFKKNATSNPFDTRKLSHV